MDIKNVINRAALSSKVLTQPPFLLILVFSVLVSGIASANGIPKGYVTTGSPATDVTALLGRLGELIARERAYGETIGELVSNARGKSRFAMDDSMLGGVLGTDFYERYDEVVPMLEALGQKSLYAVFLTNFQTLSIGRLSEEGTISMRTMQNN